MNNARAHRPCRPSAGAADLSLTAKTPKKYGYVWRGEHHTAKPRRRNATHDLHQAWTAGTLNFAKPTSTNR